MQDGYILEGTSPENTKAWPRVDEVKTTFLLLLFGKQAFNIGGTVVAAASQVETRLNKVVHGLLRIVTSRPLIKHKRHHVYVK